MTEGFEEQRFRRRMDRALEKAKHVLDVNRKPQYAADVPHRYGDKYLLAESVVNLAVSAQVTALETLGLTGETLAKVHAWVQKGQTVTLRLKAEHQCEFDRKETREEEGNTEVVTKLVGVFKRTDKVVHIIDEWFWRFSSSWQLIVYCGTDVENGIALRSRSAKHEIKTRVDETPRPKVTILDPLDLNLTWLFQHINLESLGSHFSIERSNAKCYTPRRNPDVGRAIAFFAEAHVWGEQVRSYFITDLFQAQQPHALNIDAINDDLVFLPVLPLFERKPKQSGADAASSAKGKEPREAKPVAVVKKQEEGGFGMLLSSVRGGDAPDQVLVPYVGPDGTQDCPLLPEEDLENLLAEQKRSLEEKFAALGKLFPPNDKLITPEEARVVLEATHQVSLAESVFDSLNYIEDMLRKQLVAAIGKEVQPQDFAAYMIFHNRKLFREEFRPRAFAYAVRRPGFCPEGELTISARMADGGLPDPIHTIVSRAPLAAPMHFGLDASAKVSFSGEVLLHGWMGHQFSGNSGLTLSLKARARQFSSFLVLVGRISGPGLFDPQFGMIAKDKDDFELPLRMETIPSAKEFKEAISSLSPEQQRFAKAYRSMQLAGTLFAVCVIQIKPQLEKVLKMPPDSLTKEIEMTQDILELFLRYQIPSDLISYDYTDGRPHLPAVRGNVKTMLDMIAAAKKEEVKEAIVGQVVNSIRRPVDIITTVEEEQIVPQPLRPSTSARGGGGIVSRLAGFFGNLTGSAGSAAPPAPVEESVSYSNFAPSFEMDVGGAAPDGFAADDAVSGSQPEMVAEAPAAKSPDEAKAQEEASLEIVGEADDLTTLPKKIEQRFEAQDAEGAVRPTIIHVDSVWSKRSQANLLADPRTDSLAAEEQRLERQKCFDLLDALTRSGGLSIDHATLHVVIAATHTFDKTVMSTLVQKNENPIESVERSTLILASAIHKLEPAQMINPSELARVRQSAPQLFAEE